MYNFSTLNDKDLELLALDLLNRNFNLKFQSFKTGKDKGIDLRFSTTNDENEIIVQVKHYLKSGFNALKENLKKSELQKVVNLNPSRYILITSIGLSPQNKEEIKKILHPYIHSTQDIFGQDDLNSLLRDYEDIETKHFKLWLSSTSVLYRIMQNGILGRSEFTKDNILKKTKLFVPNETFNKSIELLNQNKFILITGAPGIGKTMLANMLTFLFLEKNYELIHVFDVKEAEEKFHPDKKQIFYFDDFLGANYNELYVAKNNDSAIIHFLSRVQSSINKRLILTSRTIVLNKAIESSEKLSNFPLDISKYEVKIQDYNLFDKAQILYNHIYFSNLNEETIDVFFENHFYWEVIKHRSFYPRIIEFITDSFRFEKDIAPSDYKNDVIYKLDHPEDIWKKSFENQISDNAKLLLTTIFSLNNRSEIKIKEAFEARLSYEINNNGFKKSRNVFERTLKELLGGYLKRTAYSNSNGPYDFRLEFFDPSIIDFLLSYYTTTDKDEKWEILNSAIFIEQFNYRFRTKHDAVRTNGRIIIERWELERFKQVFIDKYKNLKSIFFISDSSLVTANIMFESFQFNDIKSYLFQILNEVEANITSSQNYYDDSILLLKNLEKWDLAPTYSELIKKLLIQIIKNLNSIAQSNVLKDLLEISNVYRSLLKNALESDTAFKQSIQNEIDNFWVNNYINTILTESSFLDIVTKEEFVSNLEEFEENAVNFNHIFNIPKSPGITHSSIDITDLVSQNRNAKSEEADQYTTLNSREIKSPSLKDEKEKINELFSKSFR